MYFYYWDDNGHNGLLINQDGINEENFIRELLTGQYELDPLNSGLIATKKAKLRAVVDKLSSSDYNLYESYGSYGILYNGDKVERLIYPRSN